MILTRKLLFLLAVILILSVLVLAIPSDPSKYGVSKKYVKLGNFWTNLFKFTGAQVAGTCTDSDGGKNADVAGTTSGFNGTFSDVCLGTYTINGVPIYPMKEFFCDPMNNSFAQVEQLNCPNGCSNGACVSASTTPTNTSFANSTVSCTDSDGGNDIFTPGVMDFEFSQNGSVFSGSKYDKCYSGGAVEFVCPNIGDPMPADPGTTPCQYGCNSARTACNPAPVANTCTDSDGNDVFTAGFVSGLNGSTGQPFSYPGISSFNDVCLTQTTVREWTCNNNNEPIFNNANCNNGCSNGACNPAPAQTCTDSDSSTSNSSFSIFTEGLVSGINGSNGNSYRFSDVCETFGSVGQVAENFCNNNDPAVRYISCPAGCNTNNFPSRACLPAPSQNATCTDTDGGINLFIAGSATGVSPSTGNTGVATLRDQCSSSISVVEAFCDVNTNTANITGSLRCPTGAVCSNGACLNQTNTTNTTPNPPPSPPVQFVGCFKDSAQRALSTSLDSRQLSIDDCASKARQRGFRFIGLQWPYGDPDPNTGECWAGNSGYDKYGHANCGSKDRAGREMGTAWVNAVYDLGGQSAGSSATPSPTPPPPPPTCTPKPEICGNNIDDDCNGKVDNGCYNQCVSKCSVSKSSCNRDCNKKRGGLAKAVCRSGCGNKYNSCASNCRKFV